MTKSALIVVAAACCWVGLRLRRRKNKGAARAHSKPSRPSINEITPRPSIDETTLRPTAADPYYRLSDSYYGYSDPYHGLFDFHTLPPFSPGNAYRYVRRVGRP